MKHQDWVGPPPSPPLHVRDTIYADEKPDPPLTSQCPLPSSNLAVALGNTTTTLLIGRLPGHPRDKLPHPQRSVTGVGQGVTGTTASKMARAT